MATIERPPRTFKITVLLGLERYVNVELGTSQGCYDLQWTGLPKIGRTYSLDAINLGAVVGTGGLLPITLTGNAGGTFKAKSSTQRFDWAATFEKAIRNQRYHSTLVHDSGSQIG